jgi:hypothetical protein
MCIVGLGLVWVSYIHAAAVHCHRAAAAVGDAVIHVGMVHMCVVVIHFEGGRARTGVRRDRWTEGVFGGYSFRRFS